MDDRVIQLRFTQQSHESPHALQIELLWRVAERLLQAVIDVTVQVIQGFLVGAIGIHVSGIVTARYLKRKRIKIS
jgi:hypothetical protein